MSRNKTQSIVIPPNFYIHVKDKNLTVYRLEVGPQNFHKQDHEQVVTGDRPLQMVELKKRQYCVVQNPVVKDKDGNAQLNKKGQTRNRRGETEIRFSEDFLVPFPLYYGERILKPQTTLTTIDASTSLRVKALRNFTSTDGNKRVAGDEWMVNGPCTYRPRVEESLVRKQVAQVIKKNQALRLSAVQTFTDRTKVVRKAGQEWLVRTMGNYLLQVEERVVSVQQAQTITETRALHLRAEQNFTDVYGKARQAGDEWLVTVDMGESHIVGVQEQKVGTKQLVTLNKDQYCVVLDPVNDKGVSQLGTKQLRKGVTQFFLQPGEKLEDDVVKDVYILGVDQALLIKASETFTEGEVVHTSGDRWMVRGPVRYVPSTKVVVLEKRENLVLDKNEGVYVRDTRAGDVKLVSGQTYMLKAHEELWQMKLSREVTKLLAKVNGRQRNDANQAVKFQVPFNSCVQVYNYKKQDNRVAFGPSLVMLQPDEQFTVNTLSGSTPKRPGVIKTLHILMGPTYSKDVVQVETSDHARLNLQLSYNWLFSVDRTDQADCKKIFNVGDFIGDMCNLMASKVRAAVARKTFDAFHKESAYVIREAIFGCDENKHINDYYDFTQNGLRVQNVDIQSVEPESHETQRKLKKSVTKAIQIITESKEAHFKHEQQIQDAKNRGFLASKKIDDDQKAEELKRKLHERQAECEKIRKAGVKVATAEAKSEARSVVLKSQVEMAQLQSKAEKIKSGAKLTRNQGLKLQELSYKQQVSDLEIQNAKELAHIESSKFKNMMDVMGADTMLKMAEAGPEQQAKLLEGLGLTGFIMTDGNNPINLFNTASGLIGGGAPQ